MGGCCPICYKATTKGKSPGLKEGQEEFQKEGEGGGGEVDQRFFRLLGRYLEGKEEDSGLRTGRQTGDHDDEQFSFEQLTNLGMTSCEQCGKLMEGFCELFHQLKTIELLLNWRVETVKNVMKSVQRLPSRINYFKDFVGTLDLDKKEGTARWRNSDELIAVVVKSKKSLIKKCSQKVRKAFPKLSIGKWQDQTGIPTSSSNKNNHHQERANTDPLHEKGGGLGSKSFTTDGSKHSTLNKDDNDKIRIRISKNKSFGESATVMEPAQLSPTTTTTTTEVIGRKRKASSELNTEEHVVVEANAQQKKSKFPVKTEVEPLSLVTEVMTISHSTPQDTDSISDHLEFIEADHPPSPPLSPELKFKLATTASPSKPALEKTPIKNILLSSITTTPEKSPSRLRSSHRCHHCSKTFSSQERLQSHIIEEAHKDRNELGDEDVQTSDNEWEDEVADGGDDNFDDNFDCSSSSDDEFEISLEFNAGHSSLEEADPLLLQTPERKSPSSSSQSWRKTHYKSRGYIPKPDNTSIRYKCPDCSNLFPDVKALLIHRKTSTSCQSFYDPQKPIRVEVVIPAEIDEDSKNVDLPTTYVNFAVIDLSQQFFICKKKGCRRHVLFSPQDLEAHHRLHGSFPCKFCKVTKCYAPNLALHEELEHAPQKEGGRLSKSYNCPRCDFDNRGGADARPSYIRHHLNSHLNQVFQESECAICRRGGMLRKSTMKRHLKTQHDLTHVTTEQIHKCSADNCNAYFLTSKKLREHQELCLDKIGSGQSDFRLKCPDCRELFQSLNEILLHRKNCCCGASSSSYDPKTSIKVDVLIPSPTPEVDVNIVGAPIFSEVTAVIDLPQAIFPCDMCNLVVYTGGDMEEHRKLHGSFPCNFCDVRKSYAPNLAIHELRHAKRDPAKTNNTFCARCHYTTGGGKGFYVQHHLKQHLSLSLSKPKCAICKSTACSTASSNSAFNLLEHLRTYHDISKVKDPKKDLRRCTVEEDDDCRAYFLKWGQLRLHLSQRHGKMMETRFKCKDCDRTFLAASTLRRHRLKHHVAPDTTIPCCFENCRKVFESKDDLVAHLVGAFVAPHKPLDDPTKEVKCPVCDVFVSGSGAEPKNLMRHIKSDHTEPAPVKESHVCEFCGKTFKVKYYLDIHYLSHSGPESWQFQCEVCNKKCLTKAKLDEHRRIHTNDKPYVCEVCGAKYGHRHNLRIHVNNKHGHGEGRVEDVPRKIDKTNFASRKGRKKRKKVKVKQCEANIEESSSESGVQ